MDPRKGCVDAVTSGPVDTELFHVVRTDDAKQRSAAPGPFNRTGTPDEAAEVVALVDSPRASSVHGEVVQPDGGTA